MSKRKQREHKKEQDASYTKVSIQTKATASDILFHA